MLPGEMRETTGERGRWSRVVLVVFTSSLLIVSGCKESSTTHEEQRQQQPTPTAKAAASDPQPLKIDACALLTPEDAQRILGAPVRPVPSVAGGCAYETKPKGSESWQRNLALNVREYESAAQESSAWDDLKVLRSLHPGRKNLEVVSGMGDEAYFEMMPNRGAMEGTVIVHKGRSDFQLKEVTDVQVSVEALKATAKNVASRLP